MKKQSLIFPFSECSSNSASNGTTLVHFYAVVLPPEREIRFPKINSLQNKVLLSDFRFFSGVELVFRVFLAIQWRNSHIFFHIRNQRNFPHKMAYFTANSMRGFRSWLFTFSVSVHKRLITRLSPYLVYETPFWALSKLIPQGRFHIGVVLPGSYSCYWWRKSSY